MTEKEDEEEEEEEEEEGSCKDSVRQNAGNDTLRRDNKCRDERGTRTCHKLVSDTRSGTTNHGWSVPGHIPTMVLKWY
ncbi:hypothetical protein E2C01_063043 [Portunus trituberculatus]|uniref:Uncharacterized protein n=1 Tax=Portunus trituberculatus TaxID=210409 RepID=A0A5B7HFB5_PORTR|nr:hypothetical protein [Portunus trituberculatus]